MIAAIRAEIRKLLTVRSTYAIIILCLILEGLASGYGGGFNATAQELANPGQLADRITTVVSVLSAFLPIIGILMVTHEFRYNTITYTVTAARNRTQVFLAKFIVITLLILLLTAVYILLSPLFVMAGAALNGKHLAHQVIPYGDLLPRLFFTSWAYAMFGLIIAFIARVQVATVVAYFLIPSTVEPLLGVILKKKQDYLPFISVDGVINHHSISHMTALVTASIWVVVGGAVAWVLFLKRDAS
jgi:ABC-2 type transport system permease protein